MIENDDIYVCMLMQAVYTFDIFVLPSAPSLQKSSRTLSLFTFTCPTSSVTLSGITYHTYAYIRRICIEYAIIRIYTQMQLYIYAIHICT